MAFLIINVWKFAQGLQLSLSWHSAGSSSSTAAAAVLRAQQQQLLQLTSHHHLLLLVLSSGLALTELRSLYVLYKYVCTKQHSGTILPSHDSAGDDDAGDAQAPWCYAGPAASAPRAAAADQRQQWCRGEWVRKQLWLLNLVAVVGSSSSPAWRYSPPSPPPPVAAVVVAVGLETVVNVVVQLGSAGHTAAAACAAPSIPLLLRAPRRPSILLQPQCRIQEDSCHSTAAARPLCRRRRRRAIGAACKLATRPTVEKNMPSYHLPICLRAARCGAVRRGCRYWISG